MRTMIAIAVLMLAGNILRAQPESISLELNAVSLQGIKQAAVPEVKLSPEPAGCVTRDNVKHAVLTSADGTVITIDYSIEHGSTGYEARPVLVSVANKAFTGRNRVRVVLANYYDQGGFSGEEISRDQVALVAAGGTRYTGQIPKGLVLTLSVMGKHYTFKQTVTVEVDGKLLSYAGANSQHFPLKMTFQ